ncbi:MAG: hypothetical protein AAF958_11350 [Planctomycetota bacterium]
MDVKNNVIISVQPVMRPLSIVLAMMTWATTSVGQIGFVDPPGFGDPIPTLSKFDIDGPDRFEPMIGGQIGRMALMRSGDEAAPLVLSDGSLGPVELLRQTDLLNNGFGTGTRASLQFYNLMKTRPGWDMELLYFDVDDEIANETLNAADFGNTSNLIDLFFQSVPNTPGPISNYRLVSGLESFEWQAVYRPRAGLRLTGGLRWLDLEEEFAIFNPSSNETSFAAVENDMLGVQIGAEATLWTNHSVRVFTGLKYALFHNDIDGGAVSAGNRVTFADHEASSLVDLELGISGAISERFSVHIAYKGLFLNDVAAVVPQSDAISVFGGNDQRVRHSNIDWDGLHYGITFVY